MRRFITLIIIVVIMWLISKISLDETVLSKAASTMIFGFLMLSAYLIGEILPQFKLPKLTGYIITGIIFGPYLLKFLDLETVKELKFIDELALTFIALAAGGELRVADLKERQKSIIFVIFVSTIVVLIGVTLFIFIGHPLIPFMVGKPIAHLLAIGTIFGVIAIARSPSTVIAIIKECKARGPFTEMILGVTIAIDTLVIILFAVTISFCEAIILGTPVNILFFLTLTGEIIVSIILGVLIGWGLSFYINYVKANLTVLILGMALLVTHLSHGLSNYLQETYNFSIHLEPLLICITVGFFVQNFSSQGEHFLESMNDISLSIFIIFFVIAGANIDLNALKETWLIAIILVLVRGVMIFFGSYLGGKFSGDPAKFNRLSWMGFLTQAGVSIGLASEVMRRFPGWGPQLATMVIAVIGLNQVVGPIAFKYSLIQVDETNRKE